MVSPLRWKRSCSPRLGSARCAKCRKIPSCSSADTYRVSFSPPPFLRSSKRLLKTRLLIPISFLNLPGCPSHNSSTHPCPLRMDVCCGTFSKRDAYAITADAPATTTVAPTITAMCLLVLSSRDIDFDNECMHARQDCGVFG